MKKGKINLLSFEDTEGEESIEIQRKPSSQIKKPTAPIVTDQRPTFDLSQIKDRVSRMELDEEMVLEGEAADAFLTGDNETFDEDMQEKIKEAKLKRNSGKKVLFDDHIDLPDYVPITTKGDYWLTRDTLESEETFSKTNSRLVREDLFNEIEVADPTNSYTNFMPEGRNGLMMTKKMLERDLKTDNYDLELDVDPEAVETEEDLMWQRGQVLKGIEKGWDHRQTVGNETNFYSKQAKLATFIPPAPITSTLDEKLLNITDTSALTLNIERITKDSKKLEERIEDLKEEISHFNSNLKEFSELETFFMRYSRFLSVKLPELEELTDIQKWEHFFDDVDVEDSDLLDLPDILKKLELISEQSIENIKEIIELFIKYHLLAMDFDPDCDIESVWEQSGLKYALSSHEKDLDLILRGIYCEKEVDKYEKIKSAIIKQREH